MRLYGYIETKDELLDLMVDEVYREITPPRPSADWRTGLRHVAHGIRDAAKRHEWFIDLLSPRPHQGPHSLAHIEARSPPSSSRTSTRCSARSAR
jgi:hypothetical protein